MGKYALFLVMALTFSLLTYSYALRNSIFISNERTVQSFSYNQANNVAQGAAMIAINSLRNSTDGGDFHPAPGVKVSYPAGENNFESWDDLNGSYRLTAENQGDEMIVVRSTGQFEGNEYTISVGLLIGTSAWDPTFDQAIHAEDAVDLSSGNVHAVGDVTLNSTNNNSVSLGSNDKLKIDGNLFIGPGGSKDEIINGNEGNVSGDITTLAHTLDYPMPLFPDFPSYGTSSGHIYDSQNVEFSNETLYYNEIILGGNSTLTINTGSEGDTLNIIAGKFNINSSDVIINGDGKLNIYVETELDLKGNGTVNQEGNINQLMVYYRGDQEVELYDETLVFGGNTIFNGSLFADKANVSLRGTTGIQGNVITGGSHVDIRGDASALSRVIYAPAAYVEAKGGGSNEVVINGSVISKEFKANGKSNVVYNPDLDAELPDLVQLNSGYPIAWWN